MIPERRGEKHEEIRKEQPLKQMEINVSRKKNTLKVHERSERKRVFTKAGHLLTLTIAMEQ